MNSGHDRRFNKARENPPLFLFFWFLQALWILFTGLPVYILNTREDKIDETWVDWVGRAIFIIGFLTEALADRQKTLWRAKPENQGKWIDVGLWSLCQHPNYLGEFMIWIGIWLNCLSSLKDWEHIGALSPIFTVLLI
eukprot:UN31889